jgi:hypothetical protein
MKQRLGYHSCGFNGCILASMHPGACIFAEDPGRQRTRRPSAERKPVYAERKSNGAKGPASPAAAAAPSARGGRSAPRAAPRAVLEADPPATDLLGGSGEDSDGIEDEVEDEEDEEAEEEEAEEEEEAAAAVVAVPEFATGYREEIAMEIAMEMGYAEEMPVVGVAQHAQSAVGPPGGGGPPPGGGGAARSKSRAPPLAPPPPPQLAVPRSAAAGMVPQRAPSGCGCARLAAPRARGRATGRPATALGA